MLRCVFRDPPLTWYWRGVWRRICKSGWGCCGCSWSTPTRTTLGKCSWGFQVKVKVWFQPGWKTWESQADGWRRRQETWFPSGSSSGSGKKEVKNCRHGIFSYQTWDMLLRRLWLTLKWEAKLSSSKASGWMSFIPGMGDGGWYDLHTWDGDLWTGDDLFFLPLWEMSSEMLSHWMNTFSGRYSILDKRNRSGTWMYEQLLHSSLPVSLGHIDKIQDDLLWDILTTTW